MAASPVNLKSRHQAVLLAWILDQMNNVTQLVKASGSSSSDANLFAIVYVSMAARELPLHELKHLQERAQRSNIERDVTGVLLYSDGAFMQYLEGPGPGLASVYEVIKADPKHFGIIDLVREPISQREFSGWSMAFRVVGTFGQSAESEQDAALNARLSMPDAHPSSMARALLLKFWERGRRSVAPALLEFSTERAKRFAVTRAK